MNQAESLSARIGRARRFLAMAINGTEKEFTSGSIRRALFLLSVPMVLEMVMESLFAVVDIYFVGKVSVNALATVALTESIMFLVYAIAVGLSMATTAMVSRRVGEKDYEEASKAAAQALFIALGFSALVSIAGLFFAKDILRLMGGDETLIAEGAGYAMWMLGGNITIMLIFLNNAIFRGAGDASIAMRVLWVSNAINIVLDPCLIFGYGPFPEMGVTGAAVATNIGRGVGVIWQLWILFRGNGMIVILRRHLVMNLELMWRLLKVSFGGMSQFLIGSASWTFMVRVISIFGSEALAGYTVAFRIIVFTILPSWGLANAAATLVGQNLGAKQPDRAEQSVWQAAFYNMLFLLFISIVFFTNASFFVGLFSTEPEVMRYGVMSLKIICAGYIFFAYEMVISQAFNGAGDTRTPTLINLFGYWVVQIPLAYALAVWLDWGPVGVFIAISLTLVLLTAINVWVFRKGNWKNTEI
ncbi:MAG: MATE family efflux transporter [Bacteroidia bacterium]|nr:MATE family efflux transporter [Bacteroidia bacterium]